MKSESRSSLNMVDPVSIFRNLPKQAKNPCFLHSGQGGKSILAYNPIAKFNSNNLQSFKKFIQQNRRYLLIGYLSYDLAYQLYSIKQTAKNDLKLPEIYFLAFDQWQEFNTSIKVLEPKSAKSPITSHKKTTFQTVISKKAYHQAFKKIKHYLKEGDIYQVNLTHRLEAKTNKSARKLFLKIIQTNPVDFLAYIEGDGFEILSASPERFVKISGKYIETCPIKGTRPRGKNKKEDLILRKDLIESKKETAELNMITDLLRNDLGKVCKIGSVKVDCHRLIQKCPTVWHTYSKITGELAPKVAPIDAVISMLPGGSITGCPKKRAIEIIDELEPTTRSVYTGVIGYIEPNKKFHQNLNFNIAIRTVIKKGPKLYLQVGGGIVIDSKEQAEFKETLDKAKSFMSIINA